MHYKCEKIYNTENAERENLGKGISVITILGISQNRFLKLVASIGYTRPTVLL